MHRSLKEELSPFVSPTPKSGRPRRSFPQISLTGSGGGAFGRSTAFSSLLTSQLGIWSYGASVSQPIFTADAPKGNLKLARSQYEQALICYTANDSESVRRCRWRADRLSKILPGTNRAAADSGGFQGIRPAFQDALRRRHRHLYEGAGRPAGSIRR